MLVGALNGVAPLVAMGGVVLSGFFAAYLWFFPAAILLRRRKVEISWWVPPGNLPGGALSINHPLPLHLALRNHGARRLRVLRIEVLATSAVEAPTNMEAIMGAGSQVEIVGELHVRQPGYHVLHGTTLHLGDILGLFQLSAYFPNPLPIKVFPALNPPRALELGNRSQAGSMHQRQGQNHVRRRGLAGELRELRDYNHGDPFKNIAWKATARHRKLMVRDLENEIILTHQYVLDIGGTMRSGKPGRSKLDYAVSLVTSLSKIALDAGDRVGLVTFDSRVYSQVAPGEGRQHYLKIVDRLIETHNIVDEDLTDLTNSELVAAVANYLAHQEAVDLRIWRAPPLDAPDWAQIQAGPKGELYDLVALARVIDGLLNVMEKSRHSKGTVPPWWWSKVKVGRDSSSLMSKLRLFARLRGIELPYRVDHEFGRRAQGLGKALNQVATGPRADSTILITDLTSMLEDPQAQLAHLARARRGGRQVIAIVPFAPLFAETALSSSAHLVAQVLEREATVALERARQLLIRSGVPLIALGPRETVDQVLHRIAKARSTLRRGRAPSAA